jgi:hypothetical protein
MAATVEPTPARRRGTGQRWLDAALHPRSGKLDTRHHTNAGGHVPDQPLGVGSHLEDAHALPKACCPWSHARSPGQGSRSRRRGWLLLQLFHLRLRTQWSSINVGWYLPVPMATSSGGPGQERHNAVSSGAKPRGGGSFGVLVARASAAHLSAPIGSRLHPLHSRETIAR